MGGDPHSSERSPANKHSIEIADYDPAWPGLALVESARLADGFGAALLRVEHVGSTSVPGLAAKPVIDLCPVVTTLADLDRRRKQVETLGYEWLGEFGIPLRRYCRRDINGVRRFQLHCFAEGSAELERHCRFRDYLRAHPDEAQAYAVEKRQSAAAHPLDMAAYNDGKSAWIKACDQRAANWAKTR